MVDVVEPARSVVVCGSGHTGVALARALVGLGKRVTVTDSRPAEKVAEFAAPLAELGVAVHTGRHDPAIVTAADLVVVSPGVPFWQTPALDEARSRGIPVLGEVELASRLTDARLVGITGTKGKSTTAALVSLMLDAPLANSEAWSALGTPLIEMVTAGPAAPLYVVELSSYQLESVERLRPWVAALINLGADHADRHPTRAEYLAAKANIFRNQAGDDRSIVGVDDPDLRALYEGLTTTKAGFSLTRDPGAGGWAAADGIRVRLPVAVGELDELVVAWDEITASMRLQRPSLVAAVTIALMAGAELEQVRRVAREFESLPHRMEIVRTWRERTFVNDSKSTNPTSTTYAIRQSPAPVVLIAGGQTKKVDLAPLAEPFRDLRGVVLIGQDAPLLEAVARAAGVPAIVRAESLGEAVHQAVELSQPGDWVVLSPCGASFDMFDSFGHRGDCFKEIVRAL